MPKKNNVSLLLLGIWLGWGAVGWCADSVVDLRTRDYSIRIGTRENLRKPIPEHHKCLLDSDIVEGLVRVQSALRLRGYSLRVMRCQSSAYENPKKCSSPGKHPLGKSVDVAIVDKLGEDLVDLSEYNPCDCRPLKTTKMKPAEKAHLDILNQAMQDEGLTSKTRAWWHFAKGVE